ncbi:hypothetical protein HYG81_16980 [Natrinema zhouii]|uniref:DUF4352 domain-containing protein n=1 Tax=Natrinema zhouii TaxID=1710539 RepID=A0A7D6CQV7_9EURY|nr:hypothetical protein [Natrinema zhouii]QLK25751.1 hypothetical protein HYG81_16980 [Natrinema zhouii]
MNRRTVLLGSSTALSALLAGCSSDENSDSSNGNGDGDEGGDGDGNQNNPSNESTGEAAFELESLDMPDEVEVEQEWSWSVEIANIGDGDGTFETTVYAKVADTDFGEVGTIELDIPAGETKTYESDAGHINYLTTRTYRFEALDTEHEIQAVSRSLSWGESYENPQGVVTTAHSIELRDVYSYEGWDGTTTEEASSGMQWAFLEFEATNESGSKEWVPFEGDMNLLAGNSQYDYVYISKEQGAYKGGGVQAGITRSGWIAYEIPEDLNGDDLVVAYSGDNFDGEWSVRWRSA